MKISRRTVEEDIWAFRFFAAKLGLAGGVPEGTANWLMVPTKLLVIFKFVVGQSQRSSLLLMFAGTVGRAKKVITARSRKRPKSTKKGSYTNNDIWFQSGIMFVISRIRISSVLRTQFDCSALLA